MILWLLLQVVLRLLLEIILVLIKKKSAAHARPARARADFFLISHLEIGDCSKNTYGAQLAFLPFKEGARAVLQPRRQVHFFKKNLFRGYF